MACLTVLVSAAGCSSSRAGEPTEESASLFSPPADIYQPPSPFPVGSPGSLIWAQKVNQPRLDPPGTIWRILYHSRDRSHHDLAVSGFAVVPIQPTPTGGPWRVYAWAHGTQGQADRCAPSRHIADSLPPYGGEQAALGAVLVATDYEGLGTPGEPTSLVGVAEGQAVLDSVRAAAQLPGVGRIGPVVIAGQSQGGGAALWAGQLAHSYAPELDLRGVVALAPAAEFPLIIQAAGSPPFDAFMGNLLIAADGLHAGYGHSFDPSTFLTPVAVADLPRVSNECVDATIRRWRGHPIRDLLARNPMAVPALASIIQQNSPGSSDPGVPIFLAQGTADQQIPVAVSAKLAAQYCRLGANVTRRVYPGADHDGVVDTAATDVLAWMSQRYEERPAPSDC
jgi:dienelactone hydrolase